MFDVVSRALLSRRAVCWLLLAARPCPAVARAVGNDAGLLNLLGGCSSQMLELAEEYAAAEVQLSSVSSSGA